MKTHNLFNIIRLSFCLKLFTSPTFSLALHMIQSEHNEQEIIFPLSQKVLSSVERNGFVEPKEYNPFDFFKHPPHSRIISKKIIISETFPEEIQSGETKIEKYPSGHKFNPPEDSAHLDNKYTQKLVSMLESLSDKDQSIEENNFQPMQKEPKKTSFHLISQPSSYNTQKEYPNKYGDLNHEDTVLPSKSTDEEFPALNKEVKFKPKFALKTNRKFRNRKYKKKIILVKTFDPDTDKNSDFYPDESNNLPGEDAIDNAQHRQLLSSYHQNGFDTFMRRNKKRESGIGTTNYNQESGTPLRRSIRDDAIPGFPSNRTLNSEFRENKTVIDETSFLHSNLSNSFKNHSGNNNAVIPKLWSQRLGNYIANNTVYNKSLPPHLNVSWYLYVNCSTPNCTWMNTTDEMELLNQGWIVHNCTSEKCIDISRKAETAHKFIHILIIIGSLCVLKILGFVLVFYYCRRLRMSTNGMPSPLYVDKKEKPADEQAKLDQSKSKSDNEESKSETQLLWEPTSSIPQSSTDEDQRNQHHNQNTKDTTRQPRNSEEELNNELQILLGSTTKSLPTMDAL